MEKMEKVTVILLLLTFVYLSKAANTKHSKQSILGRMGPMSLDTGQENRLNSIKRLIKEDPRLVDKVFCLDSTGDEKFKRNLDMLRQTLHAYLSGIVSQEKLKELNKIVQHKSNSSGN